MDFSNVSEAEILADETFHELFDDPNEIARTNNINALRKRAKEFHLTTEFDDKVRAYKRAAKEQKAAELARQREEKARLKQERMSIIHMTEFTGLEQIDAQNLECTPWTADDSGIYVDDLQRGLTIACPHPILPIRRLKNIQTGEEKITIAYKRDAGKWQTQIVSAETVASANKIVGLSAFGVLVTTESAKALVRYMADVAARNGSDRVEIQKSSQKFGWVKPDVFLPYDESKIVFDSGGRFQQLFDSIGEHGDADAYLCLMHELRADAPGNLQIRLMTAAALASVLIEKLDVLPFIVNLGGNTEGGKTVTAMVCTALFADPTENKYMGDFKSTDVALETKADVLNNLPLILDDSAKISKKMRDNFEGMVYDLTSGKGKSRSNRDLGVRYENSWKLVTITTGETELRSFVTQGGALNRILEIKAPDKIFDDPHRVVEVLKLHNGWAGRIFVNAIKKIGTAELKQRYEKVLQSVRAAAEDSMQKQTMALAAVLLADQIAEEYLWDDEILIKPEEAVGCLAKQEEVSIGWRLYEHICGTIDANHGRFDESFDRQERWGVMKGDGSIAYVFPIIIDRMCKEFSEHSASRKTFLDWAEENGKILTQSGRQVIGKKIDGETKRVVAVVLEKPDIPAIDEEEGKEFVKTDGNVPFD